MIANPGFWADAIGLTHALIVLFIVGGQAAILVGWWRQFTWTRNRAFRYAHLGAITFVVVQQWLGQMCPLTMWENELRHQAGEQGLGPSFIEHWLDALLYYSAPTWVFTAVYTAFGALVAASFYFHRPISRRPNTASE